VKQAPLARQFTENFLALPQQLKIKKSKEDLAAKKSLAEKSLFPEGLITLNTQILDKHLRDGMLSTRSLGS
jgi:hypothetical protein